jgi:hypothetical protein
MCSPHSLGHNPIPSAKPTTQSRTTYAKRLEHGRFVWPSPADGTLAISAAQLAYIVRSSWSEILTALDQANQHQKKSPRRGKTGLSSVRV